MARTTEAASVSKASKVWRRTRVGGTLALVLAGSVWLAAWSGDERAVTVPSFLLIVACTLELDRMAPGERLFACALPAIVGALAVALALAHAEPSREWYARSVVPLFPEVRSQILRPSLAREALQAAALACAGAGLVTWLGERGRRLAPALSALLALPVVVAVLGDPLEGETRVRLATGVAALLGCSGALVAGGSRTGRRRLAAALGIALWVIVPLASLVHVFRAWGAAGLAGLLVLSKIGDVAGYYVGNAIGKSHPFPRISPGKTTAGCVGSLVAGAAVGALLPWLGVFPSAGVLTGAAAGAVVNVAAQAGDLFESHVKRRTGVKDSSTLFGPSGGFLDLVDSVLFTAPVSILVWPWLLGLPLAA